MRIFYKSLFISVLYFFVAKAGLFFVLKPEGIAAIWPPAGFLLGVLLLCEARERPYIISFVLISNFAANYFSGNTAATSLGFAFANCLDAYTAAFVLDALIKPRIDFRKMKAVFIFIFAAVIGTSAFTALAGGSVAYLSFNADFFQQWRMWFISGGAGMLLVTPLVVTLYDMAMSEKKPDGSIITEQVIVTLLIIAFTNLLFSRTHDNINDILDFPFIVFPFFLWSALRLDPAGNTLNILIFSGIAILNTKAGFGPFSVSASQSRMDGLAILQMYLAVMGMVSLTVSAIIDELKQSAKKYREIYEQSQKAEKALRENELRLRTIFESSRDAIGVSLAGIHVYVNPAYRKMFGYENAELIDSSILNLIAVSERPRIIDHIKKRSENIELPSFYETVGLRRTGEEFVMEVTASTYTLEGKLFTLVNLRDITERRRAEEELKKARADAEAGSRAKSYFLATMSHEIRTPMNGIIGFAKMLGMSKLDASQREMISYVEICGNNLLNIINEILDFSKIESGKMEISEEEFELSKLLEQTVSVNLTAASRKNVELTWSLEGGRPGTLSGDGKKLGQVLLNLVNNAVKFTERGFVKLKCFCHGPENGYVTADFFVEDTGIGIPAEKISDIFSAFTQAENALTRKYGGTGLGLTISQKLVDLMGGEEITAKSDQGKGSVFTFSLRFKLASSHYEKPEPAAVVQNDRVPGPPVRILLAEDDEMNAILVQRILSWSGYELTVVADGRAAVEEVLRRDFDIILMDVSMPVMDGLEATCSIRDARVAVPIIAVTANAVTEELQKYISSGMNDYIVKPFVPDTLISMIAKYSPKRGTRV